MDGYTNGKSQHIDAILKAWPYEAGSVVARRVPGENGREVLQMRIELGLLQMEVEGRPDGYRPHGAETYYDYLLGQAMAEGDDFVLSEEQCEEVDREFVQFYHRRICWLAMREFAAARRDADHSLELMEFCTAHAPDEQWVLAHEQYRPYVLFHRTKASALAELDGAGPEAAVEEIERGLQVFEDLYAKYEAAHLLDEDELVARLEELKESIREHYGLGPSLAEELAQAIEAEQYERAAQLRDQIERRQAKD